MRRSTRSSVPQWLLLCVLALAVLGMHHVVSTSHLPAAGEAHVADTTHSGGAAEGHSQSPTDSTPSDPAHDALHFCLAVLFTAGPLLLLSSRLRSVLRDARSLAATLLCCAQVPRTRERSVLVGRTLLTSVCVLRI
jgi:hypothetical protein